MLKAILLALMVTAVPVFYSIYAINPISATEIWPSTFSELLAQVPGPPVFKANPPSGAAAKQNPLQAEPGHVVDASAYGFTVADLRGAISAIGAEEKTLHFLPGHWRIDSDLTIPANLTLRIERGAVLSITRGATLTINGPLLDCSYQIFADANTASEAHFRSLVEDQTELVAVARPELTITYANHAFGAHHGLDPSEALGRNLLDFVAPEERESTVDRMRLLCRRKSVERSETQSLAEGTSVRRWVAWTHRAIIDKLGGVAAIHSVGRDITEQVEAREATARLAALVHSLVDATVSTDLEGTITSWNPAAEHLFDVPARHALGKSIGLIIPPDRESEARTLFERVRGGESVLEFESVRRRRNGGLIEVALTLSPIREGHGRIRGIAQIARDIRGRKRLERALQASERLYRDLYEASPAMLHSIDLSDHVLNVSDAWLSQLGYPRGEVLGRPFSDFLAEESKPVARERILPELLRGGRVQEIGLRMVKCDASPLDVLLSATLERDDSGNPRCALAVLRDVRRH